MASEQLSALATPQTQSPGPDTVETPLFDLDTPSPVIDHPFLIDQDPPSPPSPPLLPAHQVDNQELQAQEEIRQHFRWLPDLLSQNQRRRWGTAYRDFVDVVLLLNTVRELGMEEQRNNSVSDGVFSASTGDITLNLDTFIEVVQLNHTAATWRNKLTTYFRIKSLCLFAEHRGGIQFQETTHKQAWDTVNSWVENQHCMLPESWITTRYGSTELRPLIRAMTQEVLQGKCFFSPFHLYYRQC